MEATVSISKGVFVFANGFNKANSSKKKTGQTQFEKMFSTDVWYTTYRRNWDIIENDLKGIHDKTYSMLFNDILGYIKQSYKNDELVSLEGVIPSATLLTGVNQPDHVSQFSTLMDMIRKEVTSHVALVGSQDASSVKNLVEHAVWQLMKGQDVPDTEESSKPKLKKNQCTIKALKKWYGSKYTTESSQSLVIIMPDFESFNCNVLQDFVMIISSYVPSLPVVLVFGVATSVSALHTSFPYHVSSKLLIKVFHTHSSPVYMNQVLEDIFLTHTSPFHLSGKTLELLTDVFLFYDLSVTGLIQNIKFCMMEHYYGDNTKSLCCNKDRLEEALRNLSSDDLEKIRHLKSFRSYLEKQDCRTKIKLFEDDDFFKDALHKELCGLHDYVYSMYLCARLLCAFVKDMPSDSLGKSVREIYTKCAVETITSTDAFKESMQLLGFQSQVKLVESIKSALKVIDTYLQIAPVEPVPETPTENNMSNIRPGEELGENFVKTTREHLMTFLRQIENANTETTVANTSAEENDDLEKAPENRYEWKQKLLNAMQALKVQSEFEMLRSQFVSYLEDMFSKGLQPPHTQPFYEILFFTEVKSIKKHIVGSPRAALHTALSNPVHYLQCACCKLPSPASLAASLPDVCLAYKLHLEFGKHINLFDWLQAFAAVLRPGDDEGHHDRSVQQRFDRAVLELQFLGFIKSSKRKTDHVMRLTW